jgi:putative colanic acid biosynthesis glycosyltransferase
MGGMSLFSIITITRNNVEGLAKTHASLATQNFREIEWIVVDGASTDSTLEFLKDKAALVVSEPDKGLYDAMNKGIDRAGGAYLVFMNAGDCFAGPDVLARLADALAAKPAFLYADACENGEDGRPFLKRARDYREAALGMFTHHQAMAYNRARLGDLRYDLAYPIAADYDLTLRFLKGNSTSGVVYWPHPLCLFEAGGISQQRARQGRAEQYKIRRALGTVSPLVNAAIYARQTLALALRRLCPPLYRFFKRR